MSYLANRKSRPFFVVQSGIVAWEDPEPIVDWKRKTVSIVSKTLPVAIDLLWAVVASRPQRINNVIRFYVAPISLSMTATQKHRLVTELKANPPGFAETILNITDTQAYLTSVLNDPSAVDFQYLTVYRHCALVAFEDSALPGARSIQEACRTVTDLGGSGIRKLLDHDEISAVFRVLERKSHSVIQLIGSSEVIESAIRCLVDQGARRFHDVRALPQEVADLCE